MYSFYTMFWFPSLCTECVSTIRWSRLKIYFRRLQNFLVSGANLFAQHSLIRSSKSGEGTVGNTPALSKAFQKHLQFSILSMGLLKATYINTKNINGRQNVPKPMTSL